MQEQQAQQQMVAVPADVSRVELMGHINAITAQRNQAMNDAAALAGKLHMMTVQCKAMGERMLAMEKAALEKQGAPEGEGA